VRWQTKDNFGTAFNSNISVFSDNLKISAPGRYYVYSALKINQNSQAESRNFHALLKRFNTHNIAYRTNKGKADTLLTKKFKNHKDVQSSWVSLHGLFEFGKDDQIGIFIHKNGRRLIETTPFLNYFGIYKL
jgi:hypothetical protein